MITRSTFNEEYVPGYFALAVDTYLAAPKISQVICQVRNSVRKKEDKLYRSSLGYLAEIAEGEPIAYDTPIGNFTKSWVHKKYGLGVRASEEATEDNLYEFGAGGNAGQDLRELFTELGLSAAETPEIECFKLFNYATATTYHTCNDGLALGSAVHKRLDGTTFSNLATSSDATYTSFWSNVISAENQYDHRQKRIKAKVRGVLASPVMEKQFREILYSKDRPDTANRAVNAMVQSGRHFELWLSPYITDTDMWALLMEAPLNDLIFFWRRRTRFAKEPDFETGDLRAKCDQRFSLEVGDCRSTYLNVP